MIHRHVALCVTVVALAFPPSAQVAAAGQLNRSSSLVDSVASTSISKSGASRSTEFVPSIEDLPLMPGLSALRDEDTVFVAQHGKRIAESSAIGSVDVDEVYRYYMQSLPQLGWQAGDARTYRRNGEKLNILARANGKITTVQFSVKPD